MKHARRIIDLQRQEKMHTLVSGVLDEYRARGKTLDEFEEDYGCRILFDEFHNEGNHGIGAIYFENKSSKTAFMLRYDA